MYGILNQIQKELILAQEFMLKIEDSLIVLSEENVAKVEAMIKTDSSYPSAIRKAVQLQ